MNNKNELAAYAKLILEHQMFKPVLETIRTDLTTGILTTEPGEKQSRDDSYFVWKGVEAFMSKLQSLADDVDTEDRKVEATKKKQALSNVKEQARLDALKDL